MKELIEKYPKATDIIVKHFLEKLLESLKDDRLPEDFKDSVRERGVKPDTILTLVEEAPRQLFDVFDENEIYIDVSVHQVISPTSKLVKFSFQIPGVVVDDLEYFDNRISCERKAVEEAYKLLDQHDTRKDT